jgi:lipopolysaccharide transport system ATP-binding protein
VKPILEIQNIGKKYRIQHLAGGYLSMRERMISALKFERNTMEDFWALKEVSFQVQPGESIGIIGRNGAGKSTLLKILSKITPPTMGRIISRGRIASLLEVGTGFHPELTGRENIFFNGSLLGMKRKEITTKFDEIVDFSGVEKFLDTPLKHYSSGMQLRLAFAVAAFLEPEILIIDEVLAVGDAEFQKKCLGKMEDVSKSGRTIIFVSHNMAAVRDLCTNSILLAQGQIKLMGKSSDLIENYLKSSNDSIHTYNSSTKAKGVFVHECYTANEQGVRTSNFINSEEVHLIIKTKNDHLNLVLSVGIALRDSWGNKLFSSVKNFLKYEIENQHKVVVPRNLLLKGSFSIDVALFIPNGITYDYVRDCVAFNISDYESDLAIYTSDVGVLNIKCQWN